MTLEEIRNSAMTLPERERLILAMELMDTIPDDHPGLCAEDPRFLDELDLRVDDPATNVSWETIQAEMKADRNR